MILQAQDVSVVIDGRNIIEGVDLTCRAGTMTALVGASGSGKTTLLHCLGLLQQPTGGKILVDDVDTTTWKARQRRKFWKEHGAFVLQDYGVMEDESVAFNVAMRANLFGSRVRADRTALDAALELTGLTGRDDERAAHLSGGEKQRLSIARAVYKKAQAIFVDEPTASLDEANRTKVIELFGALARNGCTVIVATHDDEMMQACDVRHHVGRRPTTAPDTTTTKHSHRTATSTITEDA